MARIRTIKPDFWTDETLGECSPTSRLLFIATWTFCDDHGNLERSARQLKAQAFPYDNIDCEPLIVELQLAGRLIEYEVGGKKFLHIKGFEKHQRVEKKSSPRHPLYAEELRTPLPVTDSSPRSYGSSLEGNGREGKGVETTTAHSRRTRPQRIALPEWFVEFKRVYPSRAGDQGWRKALRAANARIAEGCVPAAFVAGARRYAAYCEATQKTGTEYVKQACTFLGPEMGFLEAWDPPLTKAEALQERNIAATMSWLADEEAKDATG